jgi:hypothetical protein
MASARSCGDLCLVHSARGSRQTSVRRPHCLPRHVCSETVSVFLKSPKVRFQKRQYFLGIPCIHATRAQTRYETLLLLHKASRFGDVLLNTVKVIFEAHRPRICLPDAAIG